MTPNSDQTYKKDNQQHLRFTQCTGTIQRERAICTCASLIFAKQLDLIVLHILNMNMPRTSKRNMGIGQSDQNELPKLPERVIRVTRVKRTRKRNMSIEQSDQNELPELPERANVT